MSAPPKVRATPRESLHQNPEAVRWAREHTGWTQKKLAGHLGISPSHLSEIESGTRSARPGLLARIAEAMNAPVSMLEARVPSPTRSELARTIGRA